MMKCVVGASWRDRFQEELRRLVGLPLLYRRSIPHENPLACHGPSFWLRTNFVLAIGLSAGGVRAILPTHIASIVSHRVLSPLNRKAVPR